MSNSSALSIDGWLILARRLAKEKYGWVDFTGQEVRSGYNRRLTPRQFVDELAEELAIAPNRHIPASCASTEFDRRP